VSLAFGGSMNIGRGLFRAWLVISILWIVGAGIVGYEDHSATVRGNFSPTVVIRKSMRSTAEEISKTLDAGNTPAFYQLVYSPSEEKATMEFNLLNKVNPVANLVSFPDGSTLYIPKGYNETDQTYIAQQFWQQRWGRWGGAAKIITLWALVPPIALFIFGYLLLWIGRGFKRS